MATVSGRLRDAIGRLVGHNRSCSPSNRSMTDAMIDTSSPEALMRTFTECVHRGDLDGLVALYEPSAVFEP